MAEIATAPEPADTYYANTAVPHEPRPRLRHEIDCGVCIIGGGYAGLWTARGLIRRGYDVVVLEAGRIGAGASGRNGGFCSAGYAQELDAIVARVGLDHARALYRLSRDGVELVRALLAEGHAGLDAVPGRLEVSRLDDEEGVRAEVEKLAHQFDHDMVVWPTERVRETLKTERYFQGVHDAEALQVHALNLALALAADIERHGGRIFEHSAALAADLHGVRKWVATADGRVRAHHVVFCGSAAIGEHFPELKRSILPVGTHLAVTVPMGEKLKETIKYGGGIADTRRAFDYYRLIGDRLMWGGYLTPRATAPRGLAKKIARDILNVYPQLEGLAIEYAWTGVMGWPVHLMPQIGMLRPGAWIASAISGQGLNTTAIAGELIASAIADNDDRWRLFIPFGLVWAGGVIGRAGVQAFYGYSVARDWADEKLAELNERGEHRQRGRRKAKRPRKKSARRTAKADR